MPDQHAKSAMRITILNPIGDVGGAERVLLAAIRGAREYIPDALLEVVLFDGAGEDVRAHLAFGHHVYRLHV